MHAQDLAQAAARQISLLSPIGNSLIAEPADWAGGGQF
jgi:hypothetical protein